MIFSLITTKTEIFNVLIIWVEATVKDRQGYGNVVARRWIMALNVALSAGSMEKKDEAGKEIIPKMELQFDQPCIVEVSRAGHNCQSIQTTPPPPPNNDCFAGKVFRDHLKIFFGWAD